MTTSGSGKPELIGSKKRKHEEEDESESLSAEGRSLVDEECQTSFKKPIADLTKRTSFFRSSSSKEWIAESSTEGEDDTSDESYSEGRLSDGDKGNFPASKWQYIDLKNINIFFNDKPEPLNEIMQKVKTDIMNNVPDVPKFDRTIEKFCSLTKENLLFSYKFDGVCEFLKTPYFSKKLFERDLLTAVNTDIERAEKVDREMVHTTLFDRNWFQAVERFLFTAATLFRKLMFPECEDNIKQAIDIIKTKMRRKKSQRSTSTSTGRMELSKNVYQHFFATFGRLFFLEQEYVDRRTFVVGEKIVDCIPDIAYSLGRLPKIQGATEEIGHRLMFVVEVKAKQVKSHAGDCLENQLGSGVLGKVGSQLFAESMYSVLCPNSLGIICMETTIIFAYLKMPKEHFYNIILGRNSESIGTSGKIHYTKSFDMLNADDRAEVCEFMYWLGCVQNYDRPFLRDIGTDA